MPNVYPRAASASAVSFNWRLALSSIAIGCAYLAASWHVSGPAYLRDEIGYLANAAPKNLGATAQGYFYVVMSVVNAVMLGLIAGSESLPLFAEAAAASDRSVSVDTGILAGRFDGREYTTPRRGESG